MEINKANVGIDGDNITLSLPFTKINKQARTVSGFATLDNADNVDDVVTLEASRKAFKRWRGNIREMHQPIAVGKAMDFKERKYFDPASGKEYNGVYVTAYVSKGAQATWEKILDGTLTGFSIGGSILQKVDELDKTDGKRRRVIKDYNLNELSLVDNPCNQLATFMSIEKNADGDTLVKGMATEVAVENVLYCEQDGVAVFTADESAECDQCEQNMVNIGWVEDTAGKEEVAKSLIQQHKDLTEKVVTTNLSESSSTDSETNQSENLEADKELVQEDTQGGVDVTEEVKAEAKTEEVAETEEVEKAAEVEEVQATTEPVAPSPDELLEKFSDKVLEAIGQVRKDTTTALEESGTTFEKAVGAVKEEVSGISTELEDIKKRLTDLEEGGASRKSEEVTKLEKSDVKETDNFWGGRLAPTRR